MRLLSCLPFCLLSPISALLFLLSACTLQSHAAVQARPNVLLLMVDDLRPAIGAYGDPLAITPNIDKLASQGVQFERAYTNVPVCGASRASLMTSIYPTRQRFLKYSSTATKDVPGAVSMPQVFKQHGYHSISNGKIFHDPKDLNSQSWSESAWLPEVKEEKFFNKASAAFVNQHPVFGERGPWFEKGEAPDDSYFDAHVKNKTISDLEALANTGKPFFLAAGFFRPHLPFNVPKQYYELHSQHTFEPFFHREIPYNAPPMLKGSREIKMWHFRGYEYNSDAFHTASRRGYYASVSFVDRQVGDILAALERLKLRDNTIVVLVSDHGFNLGEHNFWTKHNVKHTALHIPLIISTPGQTAGKSQALVSLVDLFPTLLELSTIAPQPKLINQIRGKSFADVVREPEHSGPNAHVYTRFGSADSVVTDDFIYSRYIGKKNERYSMLFDLKNDPHETMNVVDHPIYQSEVARLDRLLTDAIENAQ